MKHALLVIAICLAGCASPLVQRAQRADGVLDFLLGNPGETGIPVETISGDGGRIARAQVRAYGGRVYVSGFVERQSPGNPAADSHVDVLVLDRRGEVVETARTNYLPRDIPRGQRGGFPHSRFTARLRAMPPAGATVRVVFHRGPAGACGVTAAGQPQTTRR